MFLLATAAVVVTVMLWFSLNLALALLAMALAALLMPSLTHPTLPTFAPLLADPDCSWQLWRLIPTLGCIHVAFGACKLAVVDCTLQTVA